MDRNETLANISNMLREFSEAARAVNADLILDADDIADRIDAASKRMEERHRRELDAAVLNKDFLDSTKYLVECAARTGAGQQDMDGRKAGNAAKMRAALVAAQDLLARIDFDADSDLDDMAAPVVAKIGKALAVPPRVPPRNYMGCRLKGGEKCAGKCADYAPSDQGAKTEGGQP